MGCDIHGAIEAAHQDRHTRYCADLGYQVGRNYAAFGCLFGVRNYDRFDPLFPDRGFPTDLAWPTARQIRKWGGDDAVEHPTDRVDFHSFSHATMDELHAVDWDETADAPSTHYTLLDGNMEPVGGFGWSSGFADFIDDHAEELATGEPVRIPREDSDAPESLFHRDAAEYIQRRQKTRREAIGGAWEWLIFELMPLYAERYEDYTVRAVVWFDN